MSMFYESIGSNKLLKSKHVSVVTDFPYLASSHSIQINSKQYCKPQQSEIKNNLTSTDIIQREFNYHTDETTICNYTPEDKIEIIREKDYNRDLSYYDENQYNKVSENIFTNIVSTSNLTVDKASDDIQTSKIHQTNTAKIPKKMEKNLMTDDVKSNEIKLAKSNEDKLYNKLTDVLRKTEPKESNNKKIKPHLDSNIVPEKNRRQAFKLLNSKPVIECKLTRDRSAIREFIKKKRQDRKDEEKKEYEAKEKRLRDIKNNTQLLQLRANKLAQASIPKSTFSLKKERLQHISNNIETQSEHITTPPKIINEPEIKSTELNLPNIEANGNIPVEILSRNEILDINLNSNSEEKYNEKSKTISNEKLSNENNNKIGFDEVKQPETINRFWLTKGDSDPFNFIQTIKRKLNEVVNVYESDFESASSEELNFSSENSLVSITPDKNKEILSLENTLEEQNLIPPNVALVIKGSSSSSSPMEFSSSDPETEIEEKIFNNPLIKNIPRVTNYTDNKTLSDQDEARNSPIIINPFVDTENNRVEEIFSVNEHQLNLTDQNKPNTDMVDKLIPHSEHSCIFNAEKTDQSIRELELSIAAGFDRLTEEMNAVRKKFGLDSQLEIPSLEVKLPKEKVQLNQGSLSSSDQEPDEEIPTFQTSKNSWPDGVNEQISSVTGKYSSDFEIVTEINDPAMFSGSELDSSNFDVTTEINLETASHEQNSRASFREVSVERLSLNNTDSLKMKDERDLKVLDTFVRSNKRRKVLNQEEMKRFQTHVREEQINERVTIKGSLSPIVKQKRRYSSGSDESIGTETASEQSDVESRICALSEQLRRRKMEADRLRKEQKRCYRERLRAKEQSLIKQIQAYDSYIQQTRKELEQECESGNNIAAVKPVIKQPRVAEKRKSDDTKIYNNKKFSENSSEILTELSQGEMNADNKISSEIMTEEISGEFSSKHVTESYSEDFTDFASKVEYIESSNHEVDLNILTPVELSGISEKSPSIQHSSVISEKYIPEKSFSINTSITETVPVETSVKNNNETNLSELSRNLDIVSSEIISDIVINETIINSISELPPQKISGEISPVISIDNDSAQIEITNSIHKCESLKENALDKIGEIDESQHKSVNEIMQVEQILLEKSEHNLQLNICEKKDDSEDEKFSSLADISELEFEISDSSGSLETTIESPRKNERYVDDLLQHLVEDSVQLSSSCIYHKLKLEFSQDVAENLTKQLLTEAFETLLTMYKSRKQKESAKFESQSILERVQCLLAVKDQSKEARDIPDLDLDDDEDKESAEVEWFEEDFGLTSTRREAEVLRQQQLQIEQEIKQLQQYSYYYLREIPNKPPPPYVAKPAEVPNTKEQITPLISRAVETIYHARMAGRDLSLVQPPWDTNSQTEADYISSYKTFLFDLTKQLIKEVYSDKNLPPWLEPPSKKRTFLLPKSLQDLQSRIENQVCDLFGFTNRQRKEKLVIRWSKKRRDHVDELLVREAQEEEDAWTNYDQEEAQVKTDVMNEILNGLLLDTAETLNKVLQNK